MPVSRDNQKSLKAIRLRAEALVSSSQQTDHTGEAETLAGLADGAISFSDLDNAALDACIEKHGVDHFIDAVSAAVPEPENKRALAIGPWYRHKQWLAAAASLAIVASGVLYFTSPKKPAPSSEVKPLTAVPQALVTSASSVPSLAGRAALPARARPAHKASAKVAPPEPTQNAAATPRVILDRSSAIRDALAAKYLGKSGPTVVLQKGQMWMSGPVQNTYENGSISQHFMAPTAFANLPTRPRVSSGRFAVPGERMKVRNIYADDDGIIFDVATDDNPGAQFQAFIGFPFDEGTKPSADQVARDVAEVFTVERPPTTAVPLGRTVDEETSILGEPRIIFVVDAKSIFLYDRTKVTFVAGIVSSIEKVRPPSSAAARVLGPKKVSP